MTNYIASSLELHLFFARIMKEHALFLETGFQIKDKEMRNKAQWFRLQFEELLCTAVKISDGLIRQEVLSSEELVTGFTASAEQKTSQLTVVTIDSRITALEQQLVPFEGLGNVCELRQTIRELNQKGLRLLDGLIAFKESILKRVDECRLFTANYPLLIKHIIREAKLYRGFLFELEKTGRICQKSMREVELFWNQIMMEHALFIRGLLDPSEDGLIETADEFVREYAALLEEAGRKNCSMMSGLTEKTVEETMRYRDFKAAGTKGIIQCEISSVILPLLADHVLREANHYLRILKE